MHLLWFGFLRKKKPFVHKIKLCKQWNCIVVGTKLPFSYGCWHNNHKVSGVRDLSASSWFQMICSALHYRHGHLYHCEDSSDHTYHMFGMLHSFLFTVFCICQKKVSFLLFSRYCCVCTVLRYISQVQSNICIICVIPKLSRRHIHFLDC